MARGYSGANAILDLNIDYEYRGHQKESWQEVVNDIELSLTHARRNLSDMKTDFELIKENMEMLAKEFLVQNGNVRNKILLNSIEAKIIGNQIKLIAPARDPKTKHPYAGHIEYGFTDRGGSPRGPWPFLRPAVRLAAKASTGLLADGFIQSFTNDFRYGSNRLEFGRSNMRIDKSSARSITRSTREAIKNKGIGNSSRSRSEWKGTLHGIKSKSESSNFITNYHSQWGHGNL